MKLETNRKFLLRQSKSHYAACKSLQVRDESVQCNSGWLALAHFRPSRSYKPEEPGSRPASSAEFCVWHPSSSRPSPLPCQGPREPYLRASLPQHRDASGGRGELFHSSLHRSQGCEGFVDPGITSGTFLPSLPTPRDRGTVAKAAPGQPQCPADTDRARAAAKGTATSLNPLHRPLPPLPREGQGEPEPQADEPPRSRPPSFSPPRALASSPSAPGAYGRIEKPSERLR
ncbi:PREDICTED: translation initiation factor IF-2-like [Ficedula albicollis]|uniref:translation initiation factor IF-2-like n=1 Tax=Ficedula albicollis TaxID=59894 RepID=UPI0007AD92E1|nr:PREDICTED: translation initiation factor IF-2-like [Ficedula albicollis]